MKTLNDLWKEVERETSPAESGYGVRRVHVDGKFDVYAGLKEPGRNRVLMLVVSSEKVVKSRALPTSRKFRFSIDKGESFGKGRAQLVLELLDSAFSELYFDLCEKVVVSIQTSKSEDDAASRFVQLVEKWKRFFEGNSPSGLDYVRQMGLYGELWCIRELMFPSLDFAQIVDGWKGPAGANQDFQFKSAAIEVKTCSTNQQQLLHVSNERQLDETFVGKLFLLHMSLEIRDERGESLYTMVESIKERLKDNIVLSERFNDGLIMTGYLEVHAETYKRRGYQVRTHGLYEVRDDFPRIREKDVRIGVGGVSYNISVSSIEPYRVNSESVLDALGNEK